MDEQQQTGASNQGQPAPTVQQSSAPQKNTLMSVLSYIGPLVIVSYVVSKDDPFVKFHIKQGLVLLAIEAAVWVAGMVMWQLYPILSIVNLGTLILSIIGIVNVVQGQQKELPLVGSFADRVNI